MITKYQIKPRDDTYIKNIVIAYSNEKLFWEDRYDPMNLFYRYEGFLMRSSFVVENQYY